MSHKEGKKNRKHGRNKKKCEAYRKAKKHEKSHVKRLEIHLSKHPRDGQARDVLTTYRRALFGISGK